MISTALFGEIIEGELWISTNLIETLYEDQDSQPFQSKDFKETAAYKQLFDDARWIFSGMIYGFKIRWRPSDLKRGIEDIFDIEPVALVPARKFRRSTISIVHENEIYYIRFKFNPDAEQLNRYKSWQSSALPNSSGGADGFFYYTHYRQESIENAIKIALKNWASAREYNRPSEIRVRAGLLEFPKFRMVGMRLFSMVRIAFTIDGIDSYLYH